MIAISKIKIVSIIFSIGLGENGVIHRGDIYGILDRSDNWDEMEPDDKREKYQVGCAQ